MMRDCEVHRVQKVSYTGSSIVVIFSWKQFRVSLQYADELKLIFTPPGALEMRLRLPHLLRLHFFAHEFFLLTTSRTAMTSTVLPARAFLLLVIVCTTEARSSCGKSGRSLQVFFVYYLLLLLCVMPPLRRVVCLTRKIGGIEEKCRYNV